jgi:hypothetical protein
MKKLHIYVDTSVIGGCEDEEFSATTLRLWDQFKKGVHIQVLSDLTLKELEGAPEGVRARLNQVPERFQRFVQVGPEVEALARVYLDHGIIGPGSWADAMHVALATVAHVDVLVSWNFKHIVNLGKIRVFNAVNLEQGYGLIEIRSPLEVLTDEEVL